MNKTVFRCTTCDIDHTRWTSGSMWSGDLPIDGVVADDALVNRGRGRHSVPCCDRCVVQRLHLDNEQGPAPLLGHC